MLKFLKSYWLYWACLLKRQNENMAKTSKIVKQINGLKFPTQYRNRCNLCGRPRSYIRMFGLCRLCFRELANKGELPGVRKASW